MSAKDLTEWTPCVKLPVVVHVRKQRAGESHVSTREGITPVKPDDLIMRGVSWEEYPIGREIFEKTYSLDLAQAQPAAQHIEHCIWARNGNTPCPHTQSADEPAALVMNHEFAGHEFTLRQSEP